MRTEGHISLSPVAGVVVPAHLKGTRAALFFLLRAAQKPAWAKKPLAARPAVSSRVHQKATAKADEALLLQKYFGEDQFEFHSNAAPSGIVRSMSVTRTRPAQAARA
ncbi:MAG: hypothetical protein AAFY39_07530 [Pseudomonadota bacterium]